ncbi:ATP-binding protein [Candidatus Woesearchaeota archaeon]|nr:ATP-binding protein [Candidatus Woesearchaeota archaeon]
MKKITVLSGKGGVGKSSITASLAISIAEKHRIACADCDVDASNLSLIFGINKFDEWSSITTKEKASFDYQKCNSCGKCFDACHFKSIEMIDDRPLLKQFSCEGCGVCEIVCPSKAITMLPIDNAKIGIALTKYGFNIYSAQLNIGESGSGGIVSEVKKMAQDAQADIMLIDSAAGIGCPVIASVSGSDYAIIVTEPTPTGFHDMKRAIEILKHFKIKFGLIINKYDINDCSNIEDYAAANSISVLSKIPYDKAFAKALVNCIPIISTSPSYKAIFEDIRDKVLKNVIP